MDADPRSTPGADGDGDPEPLGHPAAGGDADPLRPPPADGEAAARSEPAVPVPESGTRTRTQDERFDELSSRTPIRDLEQPEAASLHVPPAPPRLVDSEPPPPRPRFGWLRVVLGGLLAATLLRACVIEAYRIPSNSMERTLLIGDFVLVSKLAYGARFGDWRAPGFSRVRCGDVMVFNHPPARGPIGARAPYIKRVVALPGETVAIQRKQVTVDGVPLARPPQSMMLYDLAVDGTFSGQDSTFLGRVQRSGRDRWIVAATPGQDLLAVPGVTAAEPFVVATGQGATFPRARRWGIDEYGPLTVPRAGWTIPLTPETLADYRSVIEHHEGVEVDRVPGGWLLDGAAADAFTFGQDYYFVLGDNRDDSADSRAWGFVPMSHVIGRADWVYFSRVVPETLPGMPPSAGGEVRWDRIGQRVARRCERG